MVWIEGFFVGLSMLVFIGPVLFTLIQVSLEKGKLAGVLCAIGVFISDVVAVIICYRLSKSFLTTSGANITISLLGASILLFMGFTYLFRTKVPLPPSVSSTFRSNLTAFIKGFVVNFINPFVFGVWIAVISYAKQEYKTEYDLITYLSAAILAVLITDVGKVLLASKLNSLFQTSILIWIYRSIGIILILFGFRLLSYIFMS